MPRSDLLLLALVAAGLVASCGAQGALQRWLAEVIQVNEVAVTPRDGELAIEVVYSRLDLAERMQDVLTISVGGPS